MNQGAASNQLVFDGSTGNQDIDVQRIIQCNDWSLILYATILLTSVVDKSSSEN